jgi:hypothetical protein
VNPVQGFILDYTGTSPIDTVRSLLRSGYNNGLWNGPGIRCLGAAIQNGTALGYAEASSLFATFPATWSFQPIDSTSIIFARTVYGDANLDEGTNLPDFNRLAANFGQTGKHWSDGDLNFDGAVNLADFNLLANMFGQWFDGPAPSVNTGVSMSSTFGDRQITVVADEIVDSASQSAV